MLYNKCSECIKKEVNKLITIALYNNKTYIANYFRNECILMTDDQEKTDDSFQTLNGGFKYIKRIDPSDQKLTSLYDLKLSVDYNKDLPSKLSTWEIGFKPDTINHNQVKLVYDYGILPGWTSTEKNVCYKYADFKDIAQCYAEYTYYKKNGQVFNDGPMHVFAKLTCDELVNLENYVQNLFKENA